MHESLVGTSRHFRSDAEFDRYRRITDIAALSLLGDPVANDTQAEPTGNDRQGSAVSLSDPRDAGCYN
jgi:hypothetical protein